MSLQSRQVDYSKELDDVALLLVTVVRDIRAGKSAAELAADAFPKLIEALNGVDAVPGELKENLEVSLQTMGYRLGELVGAVLGDAVKPL